MDVPANNNAQRGLYSLEDMKTSFAALETGQNVIVQKLAGLEKLLSTVGEDVSWVRGDVGVLHEVVEKLADYVSKFSNTVAVVDGVPEQPSPPMSAWGTWRSEEHAKEGERAGRTTFVEERALEVEEERSHTPMYEDADSSILETQMFDVNTDMHTSIISLADEGEHGAWYKDHEGRPAVTPPPANQTGVELQDDAVEAGCTQMELTTDGLQTGTQAPGGYIWSLFTSTIRGLPAPVVGEGKTSEGWVQSKRGRASGSEVAGKERMQSMSTNSEEHTNFNLNLSPENVERMDSMQGRGINVAGSGRGWGSRGGGRGAARGTGRVKRPPVVQPRYRSKARFPTQHPRFHAWYFLFLFFSFGFLFDACIIMEGPWSAGGCFVGLHMPDILENRSYSV